MNEAVFGQAGIGGSLLNHEGSVWKNLKARHVIVPWALVAATGALVGPHEE
jgi:hypothetical protein